MADTEVVVDLASSQTSGGLTSGEIAMERRVVDAALRCVARYGVAKTTLDDVAREAGCARATIYRYFSGKRGLLMAVVDAEGARIIESIRVAGEAEQTLDDAVVAMMLKAAAELVDHEALQFVLAHEAEIVLPFIAFDGGDRFLSDASAVFAPMLERFLPLKRSARAAEWCTRVLLAHLAPNGVPRVAMTDESAVRELVQRFVAPGLVQQSLHSSPRG